MKTSKSVRVLFFLIISGSFLVGAGKSWAVSTWVSVHCHGACSSTTLTDHDFGLWSASSERRCFHSGTHSHAWASANVEWFRVNKNVGGHGWFYDGCSPKHWWWHSKSSTNTLVAKGDVSPGDPVMLRARIHPSSNAITSRIPAYENQPLGEDIPNGMFAQEDLSTTVDILIRVIQEPNIVTVLASRVAVGGPTSPSPGLIASDPIASAITFVEDPRRNSVIITEEIVTPPVPVRAGEPFTRLNSR